MILKIRDKYRKETGKSTLVHPAFYIGWLEEQLAVLLIKEESEKSDNE